MLINLTLFVVIDAPASHNFSKITLSDGLPSSVVRDIAQNTDGFIVFATSAGVAKYDGYNITVLNDNQGESLGDVWSIDTGANNTFAIASKTRGLFKYEQNQIKKIDIFTIETQVTSVKYDFNNKLWIGTNDGIYKLENNKKNNIVELKNEKVSDFLNLNQSELLAITDKNIYRININSNKFKTVNLK